MIRFWMFAAAALVVLTTATGAALAATGLRSSEQAARAPRAVLSGLVCQTALDPPARAVAITAVMRPVTGTEKLAVEFQLLERQSSSTGGTVWTPLVAPGLGVWVSPTDPATLGQRPNDVWIVKKPIADLDAPATYRFLVTFRWLGAKSAVLQTTTALSKVCHQPELRPDLAVQSISVAAGKKKATAAYSAVIENLGATGAGPFAVALSDAGTEVDLKTVQHLGAHSSTTVTLSGPICNPARPPVITVDPTDQIDVYSRTQATLAAPCSDAPSSTTTSSTPTSTTSGTTTSAAGQPLGPGADGIPVSS